MSFNEIIGQDEVKTILQKSLEKERIASAYLFIGPHGVGKTMTALNFAKAMNCKKQKTDACSTDTQKTKCSSCRKIETFSHPDISILFPVPKKIREEKRRNELLRKGEIHTYQKTEVISIDDIRDVEDALLMKPFEAKRRAVIIVDAETMTLHAQNSFLKILEEPPQDTTIILTSSQPERLLSTIMSRCQRINFKRLSREEMKAFLQERGELTEEEINLICFLSNGSIDFAKAFIDEDRKKEREFLKNIIIKQDYEKLSETYSKEGLKKLIDFFLPILRDIYISKTGERILNADIEDYIHSIHNRYSSYEIKEEIELLRNSLINISRNVSPELIANVIFNRFKKTV